MKIELKNCKYKNLLLVALVICITIFVTFTIYFHDIYYSSLFFVLIFGIPLDIFLEWRIKREKENPEIEAIVSLHKNKVDVLTILCKVASLFWIILLLIISIFARTTDGKNGFVIIPVLGFPAIIFLIWRFISEKDERAKNKIERAKIKTETAHRNKMYKEYKKIENEKKAKLKAIEEVKKAKFNTLTPNEKKSFTNAKQLGIDENWGELITFYNNYDYEENRSLNPGSFYLYEKGMKVTFYNHHKSYFIESDKIEFTTSTENGIFVLTFFLDERTKRSYKETRNAIEIPLSLIDKNPTIKTKLKELLDWYSTYLSSNEKYVKEYEGYLSEIEKLTKSYKIVSYPMDLKNIDICSYFINKYKNVIIGRNLKNEDLLLNYVVYDTLEEPDHHYIMNIILKYNDFLDFTVNGEVNMINKYPEEKKTSEHYTIGRVAMGYAVAGTTGALLLGKSKERGPRIIIPETIIEDNRKLEINLKRNLDNCLTFKMNNDKPILRTEHTEFDNYFMPQFKFMYELLFDFGLFPIFKELFPEKEKHTGIHQIL